MYIEVKLWVNFNSKQQGLTVQSFILLSTIVRRRLQIINFDLLINLYLIIILIY